MESSLNASALTRIGGSISEHVIRLPTLPENRESQELDGSPSQQMKMDDDCGGAEEDTAGSTRSKEGWLRRPRHGVMPDERKTKHDRVAPLEQALRGFANRKKDVVVAPFVGLVFDSLGEAYDFYNLYSWELGFGIRYGKSRTNVKGTKCMQELLCACSGKPKKSNPTPCRSECPAMLRLLRTEDQGWFISRAMEVAIKNVFPGTTH